MTDKKIREMREKITAIIYGLQDDYEFDVLSEIDFVDMLEMDSVDEMIEYVRELNEDCAITDEDVIYYASAMEYLAENDPSLKDSLEIASEYGYEIENLSSETLASLLKSRNNLEDFDEFLEELREKLEELEQLEQ